MTKLDLRVVEADGRLTPTTHAVQQVLLAGYTGRDRAVVMQHIHELQALGVAPPERIPTIFVVEPELLTREARVEVDERQTSGEAEFYLVPTTAGVLVGVGSDHTDRKQEAVDVAASKRLCPKVVSSSVWRYADVKEQWDQLELRAWVTNASGGRDLYQAGHLEALLPVAGLLAELDQAGHGVLTGRVIFGGTLPVIGGLEQAFGRPFEVELYDPRLERKLTCSYTVNVTTS